MKTFHVQLLFKAATYSYFIYRAANNNIPTKQTPFNSSGECTNEKKLRNDQSANEERETLTKRNKNLLRQ